MQEKRSAQYTVSQQKTTKKKEADKNTEPNPCLKRVVWVRHLKNKDPEWLWAAIEPPDSSKNPELQPTIERFSSYTATADHILSNP